MDAVAALHCVLFCLLIHLRLDCSLQLQHDFYEDLIFVPMRHTTFTIDMEKRLALQKEIDQESQPRKPAKHLACQSMVALERKATQPETEALV